MFKLLCILLLRRLVVTVTSGLIIAFTTINSSLAGVTCNSVKGEYGSWSPPVNVAELAVGGVISEMKFLAKFQYLYTPTGYVREITGFFGEWPVHTSDKIVNTNIEGVGLVVMFGGTPSSSFDILTGSKAHYDKEELHSGSPWLWARLIKTKEKVAGGAVSPFIMNYLASVRQVSWQIGTTSTWNPEPYPIYPGCLARISLPGPAVPVIKPTVASCVLNTPAINLPMGTLSLSALPSVGTEIKAQPFTISLNKCASDARPRISMSDANMPTNSGNFLTLKNDVSAAKGIGIRIKHDEQNVMFGPLLSTVSDSATQFDMGTPVGGSLNLTLEAFYVRIAEQVAGGAVKANANFVIVYP